MPTGEGILARARAHVGQQYRHGVVPKDDPNWKGPWDCAEFASWLVFQEGQLVYGCTDPKAAPGSADAYTGAWRRDAEARGKLISVEEAAATPGAMLLRYPPQAGEMGHIAVSDGKGGTVEAKGAKYGVVEDKVASRRWNVGVLIPGFDYRTSSQRVPAPGPEVLYGRSMPNMSNAVVKGIQRALKARGFDPGDIDGDFGDLTMAAVNRFQESMGLVPDGEVGPETARLLGVRLPDIAAPMAGMVLNGMAATNPLLAVAMALVPAIARAIANDRGGAVAASVSKTVAEMTGATDPAAARARLDDDPELQATLQIRLAEIADAREQERFAAEAATRREAADAEAKRRDDELKALSAKLDDVADARASAARLASIGGPASWGPLLVSTIVTIGFFGVLALFIAIMLIGVSGVDQTFMQIVNISIGALTVAFSTVVTFWLGSSEGSRRKDQLAAENRAQQTERDRELIADQKAFAETMVDKTVAPPTATGGPAGPSEAPRGSNFRRCVDVVLAREGGFVDHPKDPGGATKYGITLATLADSRGKEVSAEDVKALELGEAREIYRSNYWNKLRCDDLPIGVDLLVFDFGVNAGPAASAKLLQKVVGAEQDGSVGDATLGAVGAARPREIIDEFTKLKMVRYKDMRGWDTFGDGWTARSDAVRNAALDMLAPTMLGPRAVAA